jgi:hypothetical protein
VIKDSIHYLAFLVGGTLTEETKIFLSAWSQTGNLKGTFTSIGKLVRPMVLSPLNANQTGTILMEERLMVMLPTPLEGIQRATTIFNGVLSMLKI